MIVKNYFKNSDIIICVHWKGSQSFQVAVFSFTFSSDFFSDTPPPHTHTHRYQPGTLNSSSQTEKLVELVAGEKVAVNGRDSGDEYGTEMEEMPLRETFTAKLLLFPSRKIPTQTSGNIVYATTAVICKYVMEKAKDRSCG